MLFESYAVERLEEGKEAIAQISECFKRGWQKLTNYGYEIQVKAKLKNIQLSGRSQYTYVCENSDSSCEICMSLDGQIFNIEEAKTGENIPPLHPNCRCSIIAYPPLTELPELPEDLQNTPIEILWDLVTSAIQRAEGELDDLADAFGEIWGFFFKECIEDTYGTYTTVMIGGVSYRINMASFESVAIMPDGTYLIPELVTKIDERMLALMKERDSLPEGDSRIEELNAELQAIYESADESERHVYWKKPYSFFGSVEM